METPEQCVIVSFLFNFEHISHIVLLFELSTFNKKISAGMSGNIFDKLLASCAPTQLKLTIYYSHK